MTRRCYDDSCELGHCAKCDSHIMPGEGMACSGMCFDCWMMEEEQYNDMMRAKYEEELKKKNFSSPSHPGPV